MKALFILSDSPYGTERTYNALRLANNLSKKDESAEVTVFLMGDAVSAAKAGQQTPNGYYNLERMLKADRPRGEGASLRHVHGCPGAAGEGAARRQPPEHPRPAYRAHSGGG